VTRRLLAGVASAVLIVAIGPPQVGAAAEYEMDTVARYVVDAARAQIAVTVDVTFTNTLVNPAGQVSGFDHVAIALHDGAAHVTASDARGALSVGVKDVDGVATASVRTRSRVRYKRSVSFTLAYVLADGSAPDVHVRDEVIKFAAFGFGTSSKVTVELPASYAVRADGDPMVTEPDGQLVRLTSGPIAEPDRWLALVTASQPTTFTTRSASVALASGTVDLQVRSWADDPAWGSRTLQALTDGLPRLEEIIGLPYARVGPLVIAEDIGGEGFGGQSGGSSGEIAVAFDAPTFTLLHQAAHIWITPQLAAERWIREGLASHYAGLVAAAIGVSPPYDPVKRAAELAGSALPLAAWDTTPGVGDAYAYAASWALVDRIAAAVGEAHLAEVLRRASSGASAYDPGKPGDVSPGSEVVAMSTAELLDQLATVSGMDLAPLFDVVLGPDGQEQLSRRSVARGDYARLAARAGSWGVPDPIRAAMAAWRFDEAREAIAATLRWLRGRDDLTATVAAAGLAPPDTLRIRYVADGAGPDAQAELDAERAVAEPYLALQRRLQRSPSPLEAIGLFGAEDPRRVLAQAGASFAMGDMATSATALDQAQVQVDRAAANGIVRLAGAALLLAVGVLIVGRSRRHEGSHYTARP